MRPTSKPRATAVWNPPNVRGLKLRILTEFITDWRTTGAIAATSRFTHHRLLEPVDWGRARTVVELGPGCGSATRAILRRLHPDARFVAVEINDRFVDRLQRELDDPRFLVIHGSAADLPRLLADRRLPRADAIVSTLPFSNLPSELREHIIQASAESLVGGGVLTAVQYHPFVLPALLRQRFGRFNVRMSWLNVPPALIYTCTRSSSPSPLPWGGPDV